ncbi:MAG: hypothetical protein ABJA50_12525 [Chloroflexota bacterium]
MPRTETAQPTETALKESRQGERRATRVFVAALIVAAAAGTLAFAAGVPAFSSGDEAAHVDYAFQVWQGHLPVFQNGLLMPLDVGIRPPVQWVAQHPPLFYLLVAPFVGPLIDAHHPVAAAMAARLFMVLIGVAVALAAVWAAKQVMPRSFSHARFVAPLVMICSPWFLRLGGAVYNDILLMLVFIGLLGVTARIIRKGERKLDFLWLSLLLAGGALTRISFIPLAVACLAALAVSQLMHDRRNIRAWGRIIGIPLTSALAAAGWFYIRNYELTGSFTGGHPDWAMQHLRRVDHSLGEVLGTSILWKSLLRQFAYSPRIGDFANVMLFVVPAACGFVLAATFVVREMIVRFRRTAFVDLLLLGLVTVCVMGVIAQQVLYVSAGGGANGRYFASLLLLFSLAIAVSLTAVKRLAPWLLGAWLAIHAADLFLDLRRISGLKYRPPSAPTYPVVAWAGFGIHVTALVVALVAYLAWSRQRTMGSGSRALVGRLQT